MNNEAPLDSRQLQIFLSVASKGSLKAAAAELFLTTSAISHSVSKLEEHLEVPLFHRSGRGLRLTDKGRLLYRKTVPLVAQMKNIQTTLRGEELTDRRVLRVAAGYNFVSHLAPDIVREFNECFPHGGLRLSGAEREHALKSLEAGKVDAAIMVDPPEEGAEYAYVRLFDDTMTFLMHLSHPLATLEALPLRSVVERTLIVSRLQSYTVRSIQAQVRRRGFEFRECVEIGSTAALIEMVKLGQGIALVPNWVITPTVRAAGLVARPIQDLPMRRAWAYVWPRWILPDLASRTFRRLCQQATFPLGVPARPGSSAVPWPGAAVPAA